MGKRWFDESPLYNAVFIEEHTVRGKEETCIVVDFEEVPPESEGYYLLDGTLHDKSYEIPVILRGGGPIEALGPIRNGDVIEIANGM